MPWWTFGLGGKAPQVPYAPPEHPSLTASVVPVPSPQASLIRNSESWQNEAWGHYDSSGEYRYAVEWKSAMISRVRLYAAELKPGQDEPARIDDPEHPASQAMMLLGGGPVGQTKIMDSLSVLLDVPGEGYLIGETVGGVERWTVRSVDEIRVTRNQFEVIRDDVPSGTQEWRRLASGSLVHRVYRAHKRWSYLPDSPARAARSTLRELELVNRHIIAQYLSRVASAGVFIIPDEVTFPVREEFEDSVDPFMSEWIEIAAQAIKEPGAASAVVPIPIRVPAEYVDKIKHIDFTLKVDEKIIEKRDSAVKRLATQVNIPAEVLLGMGDVNHWGAWQLEEGALKTSISPDAELICQAITEGYLQPRLAASGEEEPARYVVWYDLSELTIRPDRSANAVLAYDRLELSGEALRREAGFDEADKPTDEQLREQGLKVIVRTLPAAADSALAQLIGEENVDPVTPQESDVAGEVAQESTPSGSDQGPPGTQDEPPPPPGPDAASIRTERLIRQARAPHSVRFTVGGRWVMLHPDLCKDHAYSCPYTQTSRSLRTMAHPGRSGIYACTLDAFGRLRVGDLQPHSDPSDMLIAGGPYAPHRG